MVGKTLIGAARTRLEGAIEFRSALATTAGVTDEELAALNGLTLVATDGAHALDVAKALSERGPEDYEVELPTEAEREDYDRRNEADRFDGGG